MDAAFDAAEGVVGADAVLDMEGVKQWPLLVLSPV
jgi:hypothetical protein